MSENSYDADLGHGRRGRLDHDRALIVGLRYRHARHAGPGRQRSRRLGAEQRTRTGSTPFRRTRAASGAVHASAAIPRSAWINGRSQLGVDGARIRPRPRPLALARMDCGEVDARPDVHRLRVRRHPGPHGNASACAHYNAFQKERLGWLNAGASPPIIDRPDRRDVHAGDLRTRRLRSESAEDPEIGGPDHGDSEPGITSSPARRSASTLTSRRQYQFAEQILNGVLILYGIRVVRQQQLPFGHEPCERKYDLSRLARPGPHGRSDASPIPTRA